MKDYSSYLFSLPGNKISDSLTPENLADFFSKIESLSDGDSSESFISLVCMNPRDFADIRKWGMDYIDIETRRDFIRSGIMGSIWGAVVISHRDIPQGKIYFQSHSPLDVERTVSEKIKNVLNKRSADFISIFDKVTGYFSLYTEIQYVRYTLKEKVDGSMP